MPSRLDVCRSHTIKLNGQLLTFEILVLSALAQRKPPQLYTAPASLLKKCNVGLEIYFLAFRFFPAFVVYRWQQLLKI